MGTGDPFAQFIRFRSRELEQLEANLWQTIELPAESMAIPRNIKDNCDI